MPLHLEALHLVHALLEEPSGMFVSAVLTPESQRLLLGHVPAVHEWVKAHHMTIEFNPPAQRIADCYQQMSGQTMRIQVIGKAQDDKAQAVACIAESANPIPHITISCASGVSAKYSNDLLAQGFERIEPFFLEGIVEIEPLTPITPATQR